MPHKRILPEGCQSPPILKDFLPRFDDRIRKRYVSREHFEKALESSFQEQSPPPLQITRGQALRFYRYICLCHEPCGGNSRAIRQTSPVRNTLSAIFAEGSIYGSDETCVYTSIPVL